MLVVGGLTRLSRVTAKPEDGAVCHSGSPVSLSEEVQVEPITNSSPWNAYSRAGSAATIHHCLGSRSRVR